MKKSYRGFVLWLIIWMVLIFVLPFISPDGATGMRLVCNLMTLGMASLAHLICVTDSVYWYTGISFEEAEAAGPERRAAYANAHRKRFGWLALAVLALSAAGHALGWSMWIDFTAATVGLVVVAVSTIGLRL